MSEAIHKTIRVRCSVEHAFAVFTERTDMWWPPGHRPLGDQARVIFEQGEGGRFYIEAADGSTQEMGAVLSWQPPNRLVYSWFLGTSPSLPTEVELQFVEEGEYTCVNVTHRESTSLEGAWPRKAVGYDRAWGHVLSALVTHIEKGD